MVGVDFLWKINDFYRNLSLILFILTLGVKWVKKNTGGELWKTMGINRLICG